MQNEFKAISAPKTKSLCIDTQNDGYRVYKLLECEIDTVPEVFCTYPDCHCPFDAPADENWCAKGLKTGM